MPTQPQNYARTSSSSRQQQIIEIIRERGETRVGDLATELGVSEMTIRRDLDYLDRRGLVVRIHGGAMIRRDRATNEPDFGTKRQRQLSEKGAIAAAASNHVPSEAAIGITGGTTTFEVAHHLDHVSDVTVVTNSLAILELLDSLHRPDISVVLTGGSPTRSNALVGPVAVNTLRTFNLDLVIMGIHGMDELRGFTSPNLLEAETNRAFIEAAERLIVVADHSKWGTSGLTTIAPLDAADLLITDAGIEPEAASILNDHLPEVTIVTPTHAL